MRVIRRLAAFLLVVTAAAAVSGVTAPSAGQLSRVPPGVAIAGLPVGGFTSEEARGLIRERLSAPVPFRLGGRTWRATADQLGVGAGVDAAIAKAMDGVPGTSVKVEAAATPRQLRRYLRMLDRTFSRPPQNSYLAGLDENLQPVIAEARAGRRLDVDATASAITAVIPDAERETVRPVLRPVPPTVTPSNFGPVVVIRRGSNSLTLFSGSSPIRQLGVATGTARYPTPLGTFSIVDMQYNPWWYPPDSDWAKDLKPVPPGPGNPLGTRWMGLSAWGVGMHGTPDAASIGYSASHGCIRLRIPDAEWLFTQVHVGTPVVIVSA